ncbi:TPA: hypothetical protein EYP70_06640 [Candidatus Bathyarchaeota archaeon]|nr:hypothetical protein [Candidatus Bathyarchaeota archaeon]
MLKEFFDRGLDFTVVGGYAVSGLAKHRFSVDLDIVIGKEDVEKFERILGEIGFEKNLERAGFDDVYGGKFINYIKRINDLPVTVDLLVGSLVCRNTNASWNFNYIKRYSVIANIAGIELSAIARVPEKELLIAFKIHSGRKADVRDIVLLIEDAEVERIAKHLKRGDLKLLKAQINNIIEMLKDAKLVDSLKGVFAIRSDVSKQIENARKKLEKIKDLTVS